MQEDSYQQLCVKGIYLLITLFFSTRLTCEFLLTFKQRIHVQGDTFERTIGTESIFKAKAIEFHEPKFQWVVAKAVCQAGNVLVIR